MCRKRCAVAASKRRMIPPSGIASDSCRSVERRLRAPTCVYAKTMIGNQNGAIYIAI